MKRHPSVDVIIPAYRPDAGLRELLERLEKQTYPAGHILVINTDESLWDPRLTEGIKTAEVFQIPKSRFDHGGTRDMGAGFSNADILLFMTQDAVPEDADLIYRLVQAFRDPDVKAAYARQVPNEHCQIIEGYTRQFNYPDEEMKKTAADLPRLGIKTYFCSNVCAAYDHELYKEIGGFTRPCISMKTYLRRTSHPLAIPSATSHPLPSPFPQLFKREQSSYFDKACRMPCIRRFSKECRAHGKERNWSVGRGII